MNYDRRKIDHREYKIIIKTSDGYIKIGNKTTPNWKEAYEFTDLEKARRYIQSFDLKKAKVYGIYPCLEFSSYEIS